MYADDDEIVALLEVVREHGGYYTPHHRNYGKRALEAYADCIEIARRSGVPLHLAHAHLGYEINKGRAPELLAMIDEARDDGIEVTLDTYPYLAGSTYLAAFLPSWMHVGGSAATVERLRDPALRERLRVEIEDEGSDGFHEIPMDWSVIVVDGRSGLRSRGGGGRPADRLRLRPARRAEPRRLVHRPHRQRGERAHDDGALVAHRRQRRDHRRRPAAPARLGHLPALLRGLRAGARDPHLGASGAEDDVAVRRSGSAFPTAACSAQAWRPTSRASIPRRSATPRPTRIHAGSPMGSRTCSSTVSLVVDDGRHTGALAGRALRAGNASVPRPR